MLLARANRSATACGYGSARAAVRRAQDWDMVADAIRLLLFPALMAFAASSDLLTMTISNRVSLLLVGGFFVLAIMIGHAARRRSACMSAPALAVLVVTFVFFARGWIGGGDAKLAAATALWLGFDQLLNYLIYRLAARRRSDAADHALPR